MHIPLLGITQIDLHFAYFANSAVGVRRIEVIVSGVEITTNNLPELVTAKDASVEGNTLIDMAVKRILTTVNNALSLRFSNLNCQICENFT
jgi:hypothetical protein